MKEIPPMHFPRRGTARRHWARALALPLALPLAALLLVPMGVARADTTTITNVGAQSGAIFAPSTPNSGATPPTDTLVNVTGTSTKIMFTYNSGTITINNGGSPNPTFTPDGSAGGLQPFGTPAASPAPLTTANYAQLLYRIGPTGTITAVPFATPASPGASATITLTPGSSPTGELYLFINDTVYGDNIGAYNITTTLTDPPVGGGGGGGGGGGAATPEAPAGLLFAVGMLPLVGLVAWRRKRSEQSHDEL